MNKTKFKNEIDNFLNEIEVRKNEVITALNDPKNHTLVSTKQIGKSLLDFARNYFKDEYSLVYSTGSVRLDYIFHLGKKKELHNASNIVDITRLYYGIKYQILANRNLYTNISLEDFYFVYWAYLVRLMKNFNWTETYNYVSVNEFGMQTGMKQLYLDWTNNPITNILSDFAIERTYNNIFVNCDYTVIDINGDIKEINIKNSDYNTMKKLSKEQIIEIIESFDHKPSVKEITDKYMSTVNKYDEDEYNAKYVSKELMRSYIKSYSLEEMIKTCNHSKEFQTKK